MAQAYRRQRRAGAAYPGLPLALTPSPSRSNQARGRGPPWSTSRATSRSTRPRSTRAAYATGKPNPNLHPNLRPLTSPNPIPNPSPGPSPNAAYATGCVLPSSASQAGFSWAIAADATRQTWRAPSSTPTMASLTMALLSMATLRMARSTARRAPSSASCHRGEMAGRRVWTTRCGTAACTPHLRA